MTRSRRELERAIDDLETSTPSGGEYADPPDLSREEKDTLAELLDVDPRDRDTEARAVVEDVHARFGGGI